MTNKPEKPYQDIGARIKAARLALGLNQTDFAKRCGFSKSQVSNWESGLFRPSLDNSICLREVFGLSLDFIFFGKLDALPHKLASALIDRSEVKNSQ